MFDIIITPINETFIRIQCREPFMELELSDRFSFKVANAQFDPRVRAGRWDGVKRLYNRTHKRIHKGLLFEVLKFCKKLDYKVSVDPSLLPKPGISMKDLVEITETFIQPHDKQKPIKPYDYQYSAVHHMLNAGRSICLAATSAGKSLCIYMAVRMYQMADELQGRTIIIVVPSIMLVEQLYSDFENYSNYPGSKWNTSTFCQKISGKYGKQVNKQIVITTWQSLKNMSPAVVADAGAIFVDETHTVNGPVLTNLMEMAINCPIRHGLTGTLDGFECNELAAQGLLGPAVKIISAKENIDAGRATLVEVKCIILDYDKETKKRYKADQDNVPKTRAQLKYQSEISFINNLKSRFDFIQGMVKTLKGNTIVLFDRVDDYGIPLYEDMKAKHENTFLIVGGVDGEEREEIRLNLENYDNAVVYATSQIMSTGVNIKNLHNIILASSSKSKIRILQTIGRLMRLHESKKHATLIDLVDKLDYNGIPNFTLKHVEERINHYSKEKHPVKFLTISLNEKNNTEDVTLDSF
jgi:superfamily II DNA or RNA helicase